MSKVAMKGKSKTSKVEDENKKASLDNIPQDVGLVLAELVTNFADASKHPNWNDRVKAERIRDYTLRSIARTCKQNYNFWFQFAVQNVRTSYVGLPSLYRLMVRKKNSEGTPLGKFVKYIYFGPTAYLPFQLGLSLQQEFCQLSKNSSLPSFMREQDGMKVACQGIYENLDNLETLILESARSIFPLQQVVNGRSVPLKCFTNSLKTLHIAVWNDQNSHLDFTARNVIFLLAFCEKIEEASIAFAVSYLDVKFLSEHAEAFKGSSSVKRLALRPKFVAKEGSKKTWFGKDEEYLYQGWKAGNKKSESIYDLLQITSGLTALEIFSDREWCNSGDETNLFTGCLRSLSSSFDTLRHLRLFGVTPNPHETHQHGHNPHFIPPSSTDYSAFKSLRILTIDCLGLERLSTDPAIKLPDSIEIINLPFHYFIPNRPVGEQFLEEGFLSDLIVKRSLQKKKLKQVVVPTRPISIDGILMNDASIETRWKDKRREFERASVFTNGSIDLRKAESGDYVGDDGEIFMSSLRWICGR